MFLGKNGWRGTMTISSSFKMMSSYSQSGRYSKERKIKAKHKKERPRINRINRQEVLFNLEEEKEIEKMENELYENKEMFLPLSPLKFDPMGKLLIYHSDKFASKRRFFKGCLVLPSIVLYCGIRAI